MSATPLPRARRGPYRRSLLFGAPWALAGAALTAGCTTGASPERAAKRREGSAGEHALDDAVRDSAGLLARYEAVAAAHPALGTRIAPLRAQVEQQVTAFRAAGGRPAPVSSGSPAGTAPSPAASPHLSPAPSVPPTETGALAALAAAERTLAGRRTAAVPDVPGGTARLLASAAAAGAAHAYLLVQGAS